MSRCCQKAWNSSNQVLVLCWEKDFKDKMDSKQENVRFIKEKVHTQERSADPFVVHKRDDWAFMLLCEMCLPQTVLRHRHITRLM